MKNTVYVLTGATLLLGCLYKAKKNKKEGGIDNSGTYFIGAMAGVTLMMFPLLGHIKK